MNKPLVSIIMPAWNVQEYIRQAIDSVLQQSYRRWELLVIDDGSTDQTATYVQAYQEQDKRIRYVYQTNQGQSAARNRGVQMAEGEYVAFLDSDDYWLPDKLAVSLESALARQADLLFTGIYIRTENDKHLPDCQLPNSATLEKKYQGEEGLQLLLFRNRIATSTVVLKKEVLRAVGGFEGKLAEDYRLWLRLLLSGYTLYGISDNLSVYRIHQASISSADRYASKSVLLMLQDLQAHEGLAMSSNYQEQAKQWVVLFIRKAFTRDEMDFLVECIRGFGLYKPGMEVGVRCSGFLPLALLKRLFRMLI